MFGRSVRLFRILRFDVRVNISWAFLAILIAISLARGFFPATYAGLPAITYWWMAAGGVVGVFFSIVFHELSHSLAARAVGMEMKGITLFLFGGVAEMDREPTSAGRELVIAIAGPLFSFALAALLLWIPTVFRTGDEMSPALAVVHYLGWLNLILGIFNLIPAFPMDGGRVLRALLWGLRGDFRWATKWASRAGAAFGLLLIGLGILVAITGALIQGLWWFLIGMFIRAAAIQSYQQTEVTRLMRGVKAGEVMMACRHVECGMTVRDFVQHYVYESQHTEYPVCENGNLIGVVGIRQIRHVPSDAWAETQIGDIMVPADQAPTIDADEDAVDAVGKLQSSEADALIVTREGRLVGVLSSSDVMKLLSLKMELEAG